MTLVFPRDLPEPFVWRPGKFELTYVQARNPTRGGLVQVVNLAPDYFSMIYETRPLHEGQVEVFRAWWSSLRGGARLFKAFDPVREYPLAYPNGFAGLTVGGSPFSGSGTLTAIGSLRNTVTVSDLPENFVISEGDKLSFGYGSSGQSLLRVVEAATANDDGVAVATIEPVVPLGVATGVPVSFFRPWCKAVIDASSFAVNWQLGRRGSVSFSATQVH